MNSSIPSVRRLLLPLLTYGLLLLAMPDSPAADSDPIASARPAAQAWLGMIDQGQYDASYVTAGQPLRDMVPQEKWTLVLKSLRPPWGALVNRKETKHLYQPNGIKGLNGECMVIGYDTSFQKLPDAIEVVILRLQDGKWYPVGYTAGPKPLPEGSSNGMPFPVDSTTQSSTSQAHPKPNQ